MLSAFVIAIVAALATQAHSGHVLLSAYQKISSTQCSPVQVTNCSPDGTQACMAGQIIYQSNSPCSVQLFRP